MAEPRKGKGGKYGKLLKNGGGGIAARDDLGDCLRVVSSGTRPEPMKAPRTCRRKMRRLTAVCEGHAPVLWCAERLPETVRVVSPEEMIWRIRMKHDPAQTKQLMRELR